jgi:hypothetical protein
MSSVNFVNTPHLYEEFIDYVNSKIKHLHKSLEQVKDVEDIYRLQGEILCLRKLLKLKEEIRSKE